MLFRKRIVSAVIAAVLLFTMNITTFATWIPDYYNQAYFWADGKHYTDGYGLQIELNDSYKASDWFTNYFAGAYEWKWIYKPQDPIRRWDFLRFVYNMQMNAYPNLQYKNHAPEYKDISEKQLLFSNIAKILFFSNIYTDEKIIDPQYMYTSNFLAPLTRSELATILVNTNNAWWHLEPVRERKNFSDIANDTNKENILKAYELGLINGTSDTLFSPNDLLTNEQAIVLADKIANNVYSSYEIFIETMNLNDVAKITESYTKYYDLSPKFATRGTVYMPGPPTDWSFFPKEVYPSKDAIMYENKTLHLLADPIGLHYEFNVNAFISNNITYNSITIVDPKNTYLLDCTSEGIIHASFPGELDVIISNKYGTDTLHVIAHASQSEYPKKTIPQVK